MATLKELVKIHCKAEGPVTALSICEYVGEQYADEMFPDQVAQALNELIKDGTLEIYDIDDDGGVTFW